MKRFNMKNNAFITGKNVCKVLFWTVAINIVISFCLNPVKNACVSDGILTIGSLDSDQTDYVYFEENQIVYNETTETCVAYAYLDISGYDYLQIELNADAVKDECRVYVDIGGENTDLDTSDRFYSQFYSDADADHSFVSGRLELGRNHSGTGVIRIMNDAGAPVIVRDVHVSGWKYYKLSYYSIIMLVVLSVLVTGLFQKMLINHNSVPCNVIEAVLSLATVYALSGGLVNDIAGSCSSLISMYDKISGFWVSDSQYTWTATAFLILYLYIFLQTRREPLPDYSIVSSYVFSFFILSGYLYDTNNVFFELYQQKYFWLACFFIMAGLALFLQCVMRILGIFMKYAAARGGELTCSRKKCFLAVWAVITVAWLPHLFIRYPAAIHWDSAVQINRVLTGSMDSVLHWPLVSTLLMGKSAQFGNLVFGSYNVGIFLYTLIQTVICSGIFAYGISLLTEFHVNRIYIGFDTLICSFMPVYSSFTTSVSKDVPFSNLVMLFLLMLFEIIKIKCDIPLKYGCLFAAAAVLCILISNKGVFYVMISFFGIVVFWLVKKEKKYLKLSALLMASLLAAQFIQTGLNNIYGTESNLNFAVCQPLQEIGYYSIKYEDEWSKADKELIDRFVIYEDIADSYRMDMADGMFIDIWRSGNEHSLKELWRFILLWCKGFARHPDCYIDATLRCNFGFYYPDVKQWGNYNSGYYIGDPDVPNSELPFVYSGLLQEANRKLSKLILFIENCPVSYLFNNVAISVWIQIYIFLYLLFKKKWEESFCVLAALVSFALCLIGPTYYCGGARYALVSVFFNVFLVGYWMSDKDTEKGESKNERDERIDSAHAVS